MLSNFKTYIQHYETTWEYLEEHYIVWVDWEKWSPQRERDIIGYLRIVYGNIATASMSIGNVTTYSFKIIT